VSADGKTVDDSSHHRVQIYYSSAVVQWLEAGRPARGLPDGSGIVKVMFPTDPRAADANKPIGYSTILKKRELSQDGWFWSIYFITPGGMAPMGGPGYSFCYTCHGSADNRELTFASLDHLRGRDKADTEIRRLPDGVTPDSMPGWGFAPPAIVRPDPLQSADPTFIAQFTTGAPPASVQAMSFPPASHEAHVPTTPNGPPQFMTSSQCNGCHDATALFDYAYPNMSVMTEDKKNINLSPYGEWAGSMMGLAGRDPIFHAQLESEKAMQPSLDDFLDNTCYRCHGVMGFRQLQADKGSQATFQHEMVYAAGNDPSAKYGTLARDGVSCLACHHMTAEGLNTDESFTGNFKVGPPGEVYGPFDGVKTKPMQNSLGITPRIGDHMTNAGACGTCHTVVLPEVPVDKGYGGTNPLTDPTIRKDHEQATYLEWRNSAYQNIDAPFNAANAKTCQDCHMPKTFGGKELSFKIANIQDETSPAALNALPITDVTLASRTKYARHTLVGLNFFGMEMFRQFDEVLGVSLVDSDVAANTNRTMDFAQTQVAAQARETASLEVLSVSRTATDLEVQVRVQNRAGHKFPSGVAFRRGILSFEVLNANNEVLWASGRTNALGIVVDRNGAPLATEFSKTDFEPHHDVISREDEVQIYEERNRDNTGKLTTSFIALFERPKDNRLLPKGFKVGGPYATEIDPTGINNDPRYLDGSGSDEILYRVPTAAIAGAKTVRASLAYQSIPPYYLRDRFETGKGVETARLYYLTSRLNLKGTPAEGWKLKMTETTAAVP
jgi:hypothetical protein